MDDPARGGRRVRSASPSAAALIHGDMKRVLMTGVRQPGSDEFLFTVYGPAENELPPAEVQMTLKEFSRWIGHTRAPAKGGRQLPLLSCLPGRPAKPKRKRRK